MAELRFDKALAEVWLLIRGLNQYLEEEKPWELAKGDKEHLAEVLHHAVADVIQLATMLLPFLPGTAQKIAATFEGGVVRSGSWTAVPQRRCQSCQVCPN